MSSSGGFARRFANPAQEVLPTNRYWVASGTGDPSDVANDIDAMAANGIGSLTYNDLILAQPYDTSKSFGTPAWSDKLQVALETAIKDDVRLDVSMVPGWSLNSDRFGPDDVGTAKILGHGSSEALASGDVFDGQVPLSTLAAGVTRRQLQGVIGAQCAGDCTDAPVTLVRSSAVDLTDQVEGASSDDTGTGLTLNWTAPANPAGGKWLVLAFWSQGAAEKPAAGIDAHLRGTWQLDHFNRTGTQAVIDDWEQKVLNDDLRRLLREDAGSMWLDSIELGSTDWTSDFMSAYKERTGQSYVFGLPTVQPRETPAFVYDDEDANAQYRSEWTRQLTDMFIQNHVDPLRDWSHGLGMTLKYQTYVGVGPTKAVIPDEAWSHLDVMDAEAKDSRGVGGVAAMSGINVNSTECCAFLDFMNDAWKQRWPDMLYRINESFSTGANNVEFHGFSQSHAGSGLATPDAWPGWGPFSSIIAIGENWDTRQPSWADQGDINRYLGRNQLVLRTGKLRSDFAVYTNGLFGDAAASVTDPAVARHGYSWGYMSDYWIKKAGFSRGVLFPNGPRYRALVLDRTDRMTVAAARKVVTLARRGLPVIILGDAPSAALEAPDDSQQNRQVATAMSRLQGLPNVITIAGETSSVQAALPAALDAVGVDPLTAPEQPTSLQTITRSSGGTTYYYMFNSSRTDAVSTTVGLVANGRPYALDAWNGTVTPVASYTASGSRVNVGVDLAPGETTIVAVTTDESALGVKRLATPLVSSQCEVVADGNASLRLRATAAGRYRVIDANGRKIWTTIPAVPAAFTPETWNLNVESWEKPETGVDSAKRALPPIDLEVGPDGTLPSWRSITSPVNLENISGLGTYTTSFDLGSSWQPATSGAFIDLGANFQTYRLIVNGHDVDGANQIDASRIDIGPYLRRGVNLLEVRVSTTMRNAIVTQAPEQPHGSSMDRQSYGLIGPVIVTPYRTAVIRVPGA